MKNINISKMKNKLYNKKNEKTKHEINIEKKK